MVRWYEYWAIERLFEWRVSAGNSLSKSPEQGASEICGMLQAKRARMYVPVVEAKKGIYLTGVEGGNAFICR